MIDNKYPCNECDRKTCGGNDCKEFQMWFYVEWRKVVEPFRKKKKEKVKK